MIKVSRHYSLCLEIRAHRRKHNETRRPVPRHGINVSGHFMEFWYIELDLNLDFGFESRLRVQPHITLRLIDEVVRHLYGMITFVIDIDLTYAMYTCSIMSGLILNLVWVTPTI